MKKIIVFLGAYLSVVFGKADLNLSSWYLQHNTIEHSKLNKSIVNKLEACFLLDVLQFDTSIFGLDGQNSNLFFQFSGLKHDSDNYELQNTLAYRERLNEYMFYGINVFSDWHTSSISNVMQKSIGFGLEFSYGFCVNINFYRPLPNQSTEKVLRYRNTQFDEVNQRPIIQRRDVIPQHHYLTTQKEYSTSGVNFHLSNILIPIFGIVSELSASAYVDFSQDESKAENYGFNVKLNIPIIYYDAFTLEALPFFQANNLKEYEFGLQLRLMYRDFKKSYSSEHTCKKPILRASTYSLEVTAPKEKRVELQDAKGQKAPLVTQVESKDALGIYVPASKSDVSLLGNFDPNTGIANVVYQISQSEKDSSELSLVIENTLENPEHFQIKELKS